VKGKILAIDYGRVRIGLAISDPERRFAFPLEVYTRGQPTCGHPGRKAASLDPFFDKLDQLIREENVTLLLVGLPVRGDGREDQMAAEVRQFSARLAQHSGLPVVHYDERYTSVLAESLLWQAGLTHAQRKQRRDKLAAQLLLQAYLEAGCPAETPPGALDAPEATP
jgi:putative Holliday junction resolvase